MNVSYPIRDCDTATYELNPMAETPGDEDLVLNLAAWVWREFGQELDCDAVLITLVWCPGAEAGPKVRLEAPEQ